MPGLKRFGEGQFVGIGVVDVEIPLAPGRVGGFGRWSEARLHQSQMERVYVINVEDQPSPPITGSLRIPFGVQNQVQVSFTQLETGERFRRAAIENLHTDLAAVEIH